MDSIYPISPNLDISIPPLGEPTLVGEIIPMVVINIMVKNLRTCHAIRATPNRVIDTVGRLYGDAETALPSNWPSVVIHHIVEERNTRCLDAIPREVAPTICGLCHEDLSEEKYPCGGGHHCTIRVCPDDTCGNMKIIRLV